MSDYTEIMSANFSEENYDTILSEYDRLEQVLQDSKAKLAEKTDMETFWKNENQHLKDRLAAAVEALDEIAGLPQGCAHDCVLKAVTIAQEAIPLAALPPGPGKP